MHKCFKIYPDQMAIVGGVKNGDAYSSCVEGGVLELFNLNSLDFQKDYSPDRWHEYAVPKVVTAKIGGG